MRLFIAEKKDLAKVITEALGNGINKGGYIECGDDVVTWGSGHLLELVGPEQHNPAYEKWNEADLPMKLRPHRYQPIERTAGQFRIVAGLIERANEIVHAGDPDAEGQLLIDEILTYTDCRKPVKRVLINDLNTEKARQALSKLRDNSEFYGLSQSALARSVADQLYGFNMTRGYTIAARKKGFKGLLSVGRVQTVILGLIVRRYEAFKNHKEAFYYTVNGDFMMSGANIPARFIVPEDAPTDDKNRIIEKGYAENIVSVAQGQPATIAQAQTVDKTTPAPLPFSLLDLQVHMSNERGLDGEKTLAITQSLRDKFKAITYNRSDCRYLSTEQFNDAPQTLDAVKQALSGHYPADVLAELDSNRKGRAFNDGKVSAHTAIIPTGTAPDTSQMTVDELAVYTAIATQYLCQFLPDKAWKQVIVQLDVAGHAFTSNARKTVLPGWTVLVKETEEDNEDRDNISLFTVLDGLKAGDAGRCESVTVSQKKTKPLPLYTLATLLRDLQRVAKYVKDPRIKALLISRDKDAAEGENGGIGTPATRTGLINKLMDHGYYTIEKKKYIPTELGINLIHTLPAIATEPDMTALWHEQQLQIEKGEMTCDAFLDELEVFIANQLANIDVNAINVSASETENRSADNQLSRLDVPCPSCGKSIVATPKTYSCTGCAFKIWLTLAGKKLTKNQIESIISKGKSGEIKGFTSTKTGKTFSAFVRLDDKITGKLAFEFPQRR